MTPAPKYLTFARLAVDLGYTGKHAGNSARKWVERRGLPKFFRGRCWLVKAEDVDRALRGEKVSAS